MILTVFQKYRNCLLPAQPPDQQVSVSKWDAIRLLFGNRAVLVRWNSEFDRECESAFWHVIKDSFVPYDSLSKSRRADIRKGLKNFDVRLVSQDYIVQNGYPIYCEACARYSSPSAISERAFVADIASKDEECYHYWGAFLKSTDIMVGYCINRVFGDVCQYISEKITPEHLRNYASYAINHVMNQYYLEHLGFRYIDLGAKNMDHDTNVQEFHISKMGFRRAYCRMNVRFLPGVRLLLFILQPFREWFYGRRGVGGKINLLFAHEEYNDYAHRPEAIYRYERRNGFANLPDEKSGIGQYRIVKFAPTLWKLALRKLTAKARLRHLLWYLMCKNRYVIYYVYDGDRIVHSTYVLGWNIRFRYMNDSDLSVGPVWTDPEYRGRGIMPYILTLIVSAKDNDCGEFYLTANCENTPSRRGAEKAGFQFYSYGYTSRFLRLFRRLT